MEDNNINIVTAYSCPVCKKLSSEKEEIDNCINNHKKDSFKKQKQDYLNNFLNDNYINYFKNQLINTSNPIKSSCINDFGPKLIEASSRVGVKLSGLRVRYKGRKDGINMLFSISGFIEREKDWKFPDHLLRDANILKKDFNREISYRHSLGRLFDTKSPPSFADILESFKIKSRGGSGGFSSFSWEVSLDTNESIFKNLKDELDEYDELAIKHEEYKTEKARLEADYNSDRLPYILLSDITYSVLNSDLEILCQEEAALKRKINEMKDILGNRREYLYNLDRGNIKLPSTDFHYDLEKFSQINKYTNGNIQ
jgi:hypothetical protein